MTFEILLRAKRWKSHIDQVSQSQQSAREMKRATRTTQDLRIYEFMTGMMEAYSTLKTLQSPDI